MTKKELRHILTREKAHYPAGVYPDGDWGRNDRSGTGKEFKRDILLTPHPDALPQGERGDNFWQYDKKLKENFMKPMIFGLALFFFLLFNPLIYADEGAQVEMFSPQGIVKGVRQVSVRF